MGIVLSEEAGQCIKCTERSAVTKEAADAAQKVKQNPPETYSSDVYTSKVKSNTNEIIKNQ